jgi:flagellar biogenesis protein FliO
MTSLHTWLSKPRATVRINRTIPWAAWMKALRRPFSRKQADCGTRIEVLDRLSLGGKKSLLLISIDSRRMLVGVGDDGAPSISRLDGMSRVAPSRATSRDSHMVRRRKMVR